MLRRGLLFAAGLFTGVAVTRRWKQLTKEGIKAGVRTTRKIREISEEAMEELEDVAAEAMAELDAEEREAEPHAGDDHSGKGLSN